MTNKYLTSILFASLWAFSWPAAIASSLNFATDQLESMAKIIGIESIDQSAAGADTTLILSYKNTPVRVDIADGTVNHIGYNIFGDDMRSVVFNFLERYSLAADMPLKREKSVNAMLAEDQITFKGGDFARLKKMTPDGYDIAVNNLNGRQYQVCWNTPDGQTDYTVSFPISYDLLHGTGMVENERRLLNDLVSHRNSPATPENVTRPQLLTTWHLNYYVLPGTSYYTDALNTNKYYRFVIADPSANPIRELENIAEPPYDSKKEYYDESDNADKKDKSKKNKKDKGKKDKKNNKGKGNKGEKDDEETESPKNAIAEAIAKQIAAPKADGQKEKAVDRTDKTKSGFELINNPVIYPVETMANMILTGYLDNDFILDIKHIGYDFNYQNISVPLNQAIDYFKAKGCEVFFGVSEIKDDEYVCVVVLRNIPEGYCHTMRLNVNKHDLESGSGRFPVRMTSYIPISKISNLMN